MSILNISDYIECDYTIFSIVSAFERRCPPNWKFEKNADRPYHVFLSILEGNAEFEVCKKIIKVSKGDFLFLSKDSKYITRNIADVPYDFMAVSFQMSESDNHPFSSCDKIVSSSSYSYKNAMNELINIWFYKRIGYKIKCKSILQDILFHAILDSIHLNINIKALHKIQPSVEYMEQNYNRQVSIGELASLSRLSSSHFRRLFKEVYKISPLQYLISIRLNKAKDLLLTDMYSIREISDMTGFSDISYFSRIFKKNIGVSPVSFKVGD